jgi:hypothetical protein
VAAAALAAVVLAAASVLFLLRTTSESSATGEQVAAPTSITLDIATQPPVDANVRVGELKLAGASVKATLTPSSERVAIVVEAAGYHKAQLVVVPDRDRTILVPLIKREDVRAAKASAAPPEISAPAPALSPPRSKTPSPAPRPARPASTGPIIVDNPFGK